MARGCEEQRVEVAERAGVDMDRRNRVDVVADLQKQHVAAVPSVLLIDLMTEEGALTIADARQRTEFLPLGGVSNSVTVLCNESGQYVTYHSDEHGFRNPAGVWNMRRADIAAVGQSHVQGFCVEDGKPFVDRVRARFPATLNVGNSGQASLSQLATVKEYLPAYTPRVVLWFFSEDLDLPDLHDEVLHPLLRRYLDPAFSQHLLGRQSEIDNALRPYLRRKDIQERQRWEDSPKTVPLQDRVLPTLKLWHLRDRLNLIVGRDEQSRMGQAMIEPATDSVFGQVIAQAQSATERWGGTLYLVYLPSWRRYVHGPIAGERERQKVLEQTRMLRIPVIDLTPVLDAHSDPLSLFWFRRAVHFNDAGHEIIGETVLKHLSHLGPGPSAVSVADDH